MITLQLKPEIEARLEAKARARGLDIDRYAETLIEDALDAPPNDAGRVGSHRNLAAFFQIMSVNSPDRPTLPDTAFIRESFYADHD